MPVIPNIDNVRECQGARTLAQLSEDIGVSSRTLQRLYGGSRVAEETITAIVNDPACAKPGVQYEDLVIPDGAGNDLCDRISRLDLWPELENALKNVVVLAGVAAQRTYGITPKEVVSAASEAPKNPTTPADVEAMVVGLKTAHSVLEPFSRRLTCGLSLFSEEANKRRDDATAGLGDLAASVPSQDDFFRGGQTNVLRLIQDDLDGSMNHRRRIPFFVSAAALLIDDQPRISAIFDPVANVVYSAMLMGPHATPEQRASASEWSISTGRTTDMAAAAAAQRRNRREAKRATDQPKDERAMAVQALHREAIAVHFPRNDPRERTRMLERAAALTEFCDSLYALNAGIPAMALVAQGGLAAFANPTTNLHDIAAGEVLCRATGVKVTDWAGKPISYGSGTTKSSLLAAHAYVHDEIRYCLTGERAVGHVVGVAARKPVG